MINKICNLSRTKMSKRKRVTADEKRSRMLQYFHENREFYTLKELESSVPKECGVIQQAVKDVLQALVDDGLVHSDKIGTSVYFWSFPGYVLYHSIIFSNKLQL